MLHMQILLVIRFIGNVKAHYAKNTNEENKLHHNPGATGPSQSVDEESQDTLKCTPLLQEGPAV